MSLRRRRILIGLLGSGALLTLAMVCAVGWMVATSSGLAWVLDRASSATEGRLRVGAAPGSSARAFALRDLHWQGEGWSLHIDRIDGQLAWTGLLRRTLHIPRLDIGEIALVRDPESATVDRPAFTGMPAWALPDLRLPFKLALEEVGIARVVEAERVHAEAIALAADWSPSGAVRLDRLSLRRDAQTWRLHGAWPGRLELVLAEDDPGSSLRLAGEVLVDATALSIQLQREGGGRVRARLDRNAEWTLLADLDAADAQALAMDVPPGARLHVDASGVGDTGRLEGEARAEGWPAYQLEAAWSRAAAGWRIERFALQEDRGGNISGQGTWPDDVDAARSLSAEVESWALWPPDGKTQRFSGKVGAEGALGAMDVVLDGALLGAEVEPGVQLALRLGDERAELQRLQLQSHGASLTLQGEASWGEQMTFIGDLRAERFDPAWLSSALQGEIGGAAAMTLRQQGEAWQLQFEDIALTGRWNQQPFALEGAGSWESAASAQGDLVLKLGSGSARLQAEAAAWQADFSRLQLADLYPGLRGLVDGRLGAALPLDADRLQADLQIGDLAWAGGRAATLRLQGGLGDATQSLTASLGGFELGERNIDLQAELRGGRADFSLKLVASSAPLSASLRMQGALGDPQTALTLQEFVLDAGEAGRWTLAAPAAFVASAQHWQLSPLCVDVDLGGDAGRAEASHRMAQSSLDAEPSERPDGVADDLGGRLCVQRPAQPGSALQISLAPIDIGRLARMWVDPEIWIWQGVLSAELQWLPVAGSGGDGGIASWALGPSDLRLQRGALQYAEADSAQPLLRWQSIHLRSETMGDGQRMILHADLGADGEVRGDWQLAEVSLAGLPRAEGALDVDIRHLAALQLLMPDLVDADGHLHGRVQSTLVEGRLDWGGGLTLSELRGSIPAAGINLQDSSLSLRQQEGRWEMDGQLLTGGGPLRVEGHWLADGSGQWRLAGDQVRLSDTRLLKLIASPDLRLRLQDNTLHLSGRVLVPEARFDIERLEAGEPASADVVVLDPVEQPARRGPAIHADVELVLGERAELRGFGFDGGLKGSLQIRERPGLPSAGRGNLELRGRYRAYGQDLTLQRGRLLFSGGALDNPGIDIRAAREIDEVTVGIQVSGPARQPRLRVWSEPAMDQAEAISYLVLGQPLRSAGSADGRQLGEAAAAMGGNLLAARLGGRLGFDTFGIADSGALGGAAFTVGKYLSPALYLSYGVGLFEPGQVVTLRYLLSERADVQVESARESRVGVNYRWETD